jgi:hypothetical protein
MKKIFFILAITYCSGLLGQQVVTTAGNTYANSSGGISYTIGEGISETLSSGNITLTQGFQQPNIFVSLVREIKNSGLSVLVYPNPTSGIVKLKIEAGLLPGMQYLLFDTNGKLLSQKKVESSETEISLSEFQPGIYFMKIQTGITELKTFKIVKR